MAADVEAIDVTASAIKSTIAADAIMSIMAITATFINDTASVLISSIFMRSYLLHFHLSSLYTEFFLYIPFTIPSSSRFSNFFPSTVLPPGFEFKI
jgi:hypothetical protein